MIPQNPYLQKLFEEGMEREKSEAIQFKTESLQKQQGRLFVNLVGQSLIPVPFKSGYIPIDTNSLKTAKDKTFYTFFPSRTNPSTDPLIIWFTGGPGCASDLSIVVENGPYNIGLGSNGKPTGFKREYAWNNNANLLYLDNPLGVGFSVLGSKSTVTTEEQVAKDVEIFLKRLLSLPDFKSLQGRDLYITGESYGGHYVPWVANHLRKLNNSWFNLKGIAIGNGLVTSKAEYANYKTFIELPENQKYVKLSQEERETVSRLTDLCLQQLESRNRRVPLNFKNTCEEIVGIILAPTAAQRAKGIRLRFNIYNVRVPCIKGTQLCYDFTKQTQFFNSQSVQQLLGVADENIFYQNCNSAGSGLGRVDTWIDSDGQVTEILNSGIKVLVYSGDQDFICNWKGGEQWTHDISWKNGDQFRKAQYKTRYTKGNKQVIGQSRKYKNLEFLAVKGAGHVVPFDQPFTALSMINEFIGQPLP